MRALAITGRYHVAMSALKQAKRSREKRMEENGKILQLLDDFGGLSS
jgi:hypothetical protein